MMPTPLLVGPAHDRLHLLDRARQRDGRRARVEALARLVEIVAHPLRLADDRIGAEQGAELGDDLGGGKGMEKPA